MRRRLAHGYGVPPEKYGWKPFHNADYGYDHLYMTVSSFIIWALVTWGSFSINPYEATAILAGSLAYTEYRVGDRWGTGASWVHNVQAGYCWYHYFVKGRKELGVMLGSLAELAGDGGAVIEELLRGQKLYSHKAHYEGATTGMLIAFLLDMLFPKKAGRTNVFWQLLPLTFIAGLYGANRINYHVERVLHFES